MTRRMREFRLRDATGTVLAVVPGTLGEALAAARRAGYAVQDFVVPDTLIVHGEPPPTDLDAPHGPVAVS